MYFYLSNLYYWLTNQVQMNEKYPYISKLGLYLRNSYIFIDVFLWGKTIILYCNMLKTSPEVKGPTDRHVLKWLSTAKWEVTSIVETICTTGVKLRGGQVKTSVLCAKCSPRLYGRHDEHYANDDK